MVVAPEAVARQAIDADLVDAGWVVQDVAAMNLHASQGIAAEIVEDLRAALEEFELIYADLDKAGAAD